MSLGLNRGLRSKKCKYSLGLDGPLIFGNSLICILIGFISGYDIYIYIYVRILGPPNYPLMYPKYPLFRAIKTLLKGAWEGPGGSGFGKSLGIDGLQALSLLPPKPKTQNPKPKTLNPKPKTLNPVGINGSLKVTV